MWRAGSVVGLACRSWRRLWRFVTHTVFSLIVLEYYCRRFWKADTLTPLRGGLTPCAGRMGLNCGGRKGYVRDERFARIRKRQPGAVACPRAASTRGPIVTLHFARVDGTSFACPRAASTPSPIVTLHFARVDGTTFAGQPSPRTLKGVSMARKRYQQGSVTLKGRNWTGRFFEDVRQTDGSITRVQRRVILGTKTELPTRKLALRKLEPYLVKINSTEYRPRSTMILADLVARWKPLAKPQYKPGTWSQGLGGISRETSGCMCCLASETSN
jgi:hypothetical protein